MIEPIACPTHGPFNRDFHLRTSKDSVYFFLVHGVKQIKREKLILLVTLLLI